MAKWEYEVVPLKGDIMGDTAILTMRGREGWELVCVTEVGGTIAYFKREK